jgi:hypothetical protein
VNQKDKLSSEINGFVASIKQSNKESVIRVEAKDISKDEYCSHTENSD